MFELLGFMFEFTGPRLDDSDRPLSDGMAFFLIRELQRNYIGPVNSWWWQKGMVGSQLF